MTVTIEVLGLRWQERSDDMREALERKLEGLYGVSRDEEAFDNLEAEKQQTHLFYEKLRGVTPD